MYSHEDRMKAVQLFIKLGRNETKVIRTLGYPSPCALRQWYREYTQTGKLHRKLKNKPRYSEKQIKAAVKYYDDHGGNLIGVARALGYPNRNTLSQWVRAVHPNGSKVSIKHCKTGRELVRCSLEQKKAAVESCLEGNPDYKVAAQYGVSKAAIYTWKKQLLGKGPSTCMKKKDEQPLPVKLPDDKEKLEAEVESLQAQIYCLQMERDVLEKATEIIKKVQGINLEDLTNAEKADAIDALKGKYRLCELLAFLKMAKSSYFYQRSAALKPDKYEDLRSDVKSAFYENFQCYGYRRIYEILRKGGKIISEKVVRRIMRQEQLTVYCVKRKKYSSYKGEISSAVPNIINRDFHADAPNMKWLTDLTEFALPAGKVYLSPVIDCFDGIVVNWTIGTSPNAELTNTMIDGAIARLSKDEHPIIHSDRGCHYRWPDWIHKVESACLIRSMSKKGCSPDNSACEGFFGRLKNEMFYGRSWMSVTTRQFIAELDQYIHWYNEKRIKISLGSMSPAEYRQILGLAM